ncbi:MAG TPA: hypothetical protein VLA19_30180 [Herpetosiphonaceae bacterium]|nr:hypothetical protein [Herpetosiphonaceae bacterium]
MPPHHQYEGTRESVADPSSLNAWIVYFGGDPIMDGYAPWASVRTTHDLIQVLMYSSPIDAKLLEAAPVTYNVAFDLIDHPNKRMQVYGCTLLCELMLRVPEVMEGMIRGLLEELVQSVQLGKGEG